MKSVVVGCCVRRFEPNWLDQAMTNDVRSSNITEQAAVCRIHCARSCLHRRTAILVGNTDIIRTDERSRVFDSSRPSLESMADRASSPSHVI